MSVYYLYEPTEPVPFCYLTPSRFTGRLPPPYKTTTLPPDYLEFAISDLAEGSSRGLVNAFGNAKRALHFEIDYLLQQYGLFRHYGHGNFPTKLQILDEIGLLPITIITNLNVERNLIEHEYDTPSRKRVGEAIDVVKLLLFATEKLLESTPHEVVVGWKQPRRHMLMQLDPIVGELKFFTISAKGHYTKVNNINCISGQIRHFTKGAFAPGISVSKKPWKTIVLNKAEASEWKPILKELVNVQRKGAAQKTHIDGESATVTIPIVIPLEQVGKKPWAQLMDEFLNAKFAKSADEANPEEKSTNAPTVPGSANPS